MVTMMVIRIVIGLLIVIEFIMFIDSPLQFYFFTEVCHG